ncbi:protein kinase domain-containing protein [Oerskovia turbata]
MSSSPFDPDNLVGVTLGNRWLLTERLAPGKTGGNFSVGFLATGLKGERAFVKIVNYQSIFRQPNVMAAMQQISAAYTFERNLVQRCGTAKLSRIVAAYDYGEETAPGVQLPVSYIVFEPASHDVRRMLDLSESISLAAKLRLSHNAATGLGQLHAIGVAHQDVKPSNLLIFPGSGGSKVADLGRASDISVPAAHDAFPITGDRAYAPPEQSYGETYSSFNERRIACDIYQLGNLMSFILTGTTINARLKSHIYPDHAPENWGDNYAAVLPYVQAAHAAAIEEVSSELGFSPIGASAAQVIAYTTDPDIHKRGHPVSRKFREPFSMNRIITQLDLLSRRAELAAIGGPS